MKADKNHHSFNHHQLFMNMAQGVVYQDREGKIIMANPAAEKLLGLTLDQLQGRKSIDPRWKAIHKDGSNFPGDEHPAMVALRTGKRVRNVVMGIFHPQLEDHVWIHVNAEPEYNPGEQQPFQVYATFTDITEQIKAEKALQNETQLNALLLNMSTQYINLPFAKIEQTINQSIQEIGAFTEADRVYIIEYDWTTNTCCNTYEWCAPGIAPFINKLQQVPIDDIPQWVEAHRNGDAMHVPDVAALDDESPLKALLAQQGIKSLIAVPIMQGDTCIAFIGLDAVRQKHIYTDAEENLLRLYAEILVNLRNRLSTFRAIKKSETRYRQLTDNMSDLIWTVDANKKLDYLSPTTLQLFGYDSDVLRDDLLEKAFPEASRQQVIDAIDQFFADMQDQKADKNKTHTLDLLAQKKDGTLFWLSTNYKAQYNLRGEFCGIVGISHDITARKKAEIALQHSLDKLQQRIRELSCMYSIADLFRNKELDIDSYLQEVARIIPSGFQYPAQTAVIIRSNNSTYKSHFTKLTNQFIEISYAVEGVNEGTITVYQPEEYTFMPEEQQLLKGIQRNVEQWIRHTSATQTLMQSEARLRGLLDSETHYVIRTTLEGKYTYWNDKFEEEFGWIHHDAALNNVSSLNSIMDYHHHRIEEVVAKCIENPGKIYQVVLDKPATKNEIKTTLWEVVCLTDHQNQPTEIQCAGQDITDRVAQQEEISRLTTAIEQSPIAIVITDLDTRIEYISPAFTDITGYTEKEILGKKTNTLKSGRTTDAIYEDMWRTITAGETWKGEWQNKKKNGDLYWEAVSITPIHSSDGKTIRYLAAKQDITQRNNYLEAIQKQNETLKSIAWTQSHVVRAPLANLMGLVGLLGLPDSDRFSREKILDAIMKSAKEIDEIIMDITHKAYISDAIETILEENK